LETQRKPLKIRIRKLLWNS